jgi:DNA-binding transcriptional MocR family regulator
MASPLVNAIVANWMEGGHAEAVLQAVRAECAWRSAQMRQLLGPHGVRTQPHGFHGWLPVPAADGESSPATRIAAELRALGIAAVDGTAFSTDRQPPEALRLCLGGGLTRDDCGRALQAVREALPPA